MATKTPKNGKKPAPKKKTPKKTTPKKPVKKPVKKPIKFDGRTMVAKNGK